MIAVNVSHHACGDSDPQEILRRGVIAAAQAGLPLLVGMRRPEDWPLEGQLAHLRPGDVVTYCFRRAPHCIVKNGLLLKSICEARERGVKFDVGHGMASFDFDVAETSIRNGFQPDTVSTDLQKQHLAEPQPHNLPLVMSKLAAAGMSETDIFKAVTTTPAYVLGLDDVGTLGAGAVADLLVLEPIPNAQLTDCHGNSRTGTGFMTQLVVRAGKVIVPQTRRCLSASAADVT